MLLPLACPFCKTTGRGICFVEWLFVIFTKWVAPKQFLCNTFFCKNFGRDGGWIHPNFKTVTVTGILEKCILKNNKTAGNNFDSNGNLKRFRNHKWHKSSRKESFFKESCEEHVVVAQALFLWLGGKVCSWWIFVGVLVGVVPHAPAEPNFNESEILVPKWPSQTKHWQYKIPK